MINSIKKTKKPIKSTKKKKKKNKTNAKRMVTVKIKEETRKGKKPN